MPHACTNDCTFPVTWVIDLVKQVDDSDRLRSQGLYLLHFHYWDQITVRDSVTQEELFWLTASEGMVYHCSGDCSKVVGTWEGICLQCGKSGNWVVGTGDKYGFWKLPHPWACDHQLGSRSWSSAPAQAMFKMHDPMGHFAFKSW